MNYKDTLLMPKTTFEMKANLPNKEPKFQSEWNEKDIYNKTLSDRKSKETFYLYDGPPYANGSLHMGHALNKILKDFVLRSKLALGYRVPFTPGWDTHGLPIEQALTNKGVKRKELSLAEYRELCLGYAKEQIEIQKEQFQRLGIWGDFDNYYATFHPKYEGEQIRIFNKMLQKGLVYKGLKPVYWSPSSESALAEAEVEYQDKLSPAIYVNFPVVSTNSALSVGDNFVIWTTTPWTMPANRAIQINENFEYVRIANQTSAYIVAEALLEAFLTETNILDAVITDKFTGQQLLNTNVAHPIFEFTVPVIAGDHVTLDAGTGVVHCAPGHGEDDFVVGKHNGLEVVSVLDGRGVMNENAGPFEGQYYEKANAAIIDYLKSENRLLYFSELLHSYPHDWRTKKPIVFRATPQWFVSIDPIRKELLDEINNVDWIIPWGATRLGNMIESRGDWCISRQRVWGVPIPIIYCENGDAITDSNVIEHIARLFSEFGSSIWSEKSAVELLPENYTNSKSPNGVFEKETDIMDVWFDSGTSHANEHRNLSKDFPADMYLEGSDQYRGWFNSSLITSVAANGVSPYKAVLSHGFALDGKGHKMSKSLGNVIDPLKMISIYGADVVRLWVASVDYQSDVRISDNIMKQVAENYRKIRNTIRFVLGNISDFKEAQKIPHDKLEKVDKYLLAKLSELNTEVKVAYDSYQFSNVLKQVMQFITQELSSFYLDFTKDILYIEDKTSVRRLQVQMVLDEVFNVMAPILMPFIPHTIEEALQSRGENILAPELIFSQFSFENASEIISSWTPFFEVRQQVLKSLENARNEKIIGKSLEASIQIVLPEKEKVMKLLTSEELKQLLIVSEVELITGETNIITRKFEGDQCNRCWNYFEVNTLSKSNLCPRCENVIENHHNKI